MSPERPQPPQDEIDYLDAGHDLAEALMYTSGVNPKEASEASLNVHGFVDYTLGKRAQLLSITNKFGPLKVNPIQAPTDYLDDSGQVIVVRDQPIIDLHISSTETNGAALGVFTRSLQELMNPLMQDSNSKKARIIAGLTTPRIAKASTRWGFYVVRRPFTPEVYRLLETAIDINPNSENLAKIQDQQLVFRDLSELTNGGIFPIAPAY